MTEELVKYWSKLDRELMGPEPRYVVMGRGCWAMGETLVAAYQELKRHGHKGGKAGARFCAVPPEVDGYTVRVARDGRVESRGKEESGDGDHWVRWEEFP